MSNESEDLDTEIEVQDSLELAKRYYSEIKLGWEQKSSCNSLHF
jgi:hypothetical protein